MDEFRSMQVFVSAVQEGSFSAAGRRLGLSPASVSRLIGTLEDRLDTRLLNRTSRALTLTEAGESYFAEATGILQRVAAANERVRSFGGHPKGTLRVHSRIFVGNQFLVPLIPRFLAENPDLTVELMLSNEECDLVDQNVDVDIRVGKLRDSSYVVRKLKESERVVVASNAYLENHGAPRTPEDLANHNCLAYRLNLGQSVWAFQDTAGNRTDVTVRGNFRTDFGPALRGLALDGVGLCLMYEWAVREDIEQGRLIRLFSDYHVSHVGFDNGLYAVFQRSRHDAPKTRRFVDFIANAFR
ncbi:LysR family transcriptional regulator [Nitratireductor indicus]|uniref:LysR family transcriptional regulator n=1 Tax=Nitratireductor indicus TaxID=721133 RepID=UPI002875FCD0|nr:LysR family transcriptional regulator [Nitratireductor indicus]MDS1136150.1 LysR family transcriptional regulator [Nitratireductor indicus]